jgi:hypothetical protein
MRTIASAVALAPASKTADVANYKAPLGQPNRALLFFETPKSRGRRHPEQAFGIKKFICLRMDARRS